MKNLHGEMPEFGVSRVGMNGPDFDTSRAFAEQVSRGVLRPDFAWTIAAPRRQTSGLYRRFGKRAMDIALVLLTAPLSLTITLLCALALWVEGGKPFYVQQRIGRNGKTFPIIKLRTMMLNADQVLEEYLAKDAAMRREWDALQKLRNDPRVTPVGKLLRSTSLDELPQLFNVFKGDMSIVGPRPMMLDQAEMYGNKTHYNALRPGITGAWQISARNNNIFSFRNEVDSAYERKLSFWGDIVILFKTVGVVLRRTGC